MDNDIHSIQSVSVTTDTSTTVASKNIPTNEKPKNLSKIRAASISNTTSTDIKIDPVIPKMETITRKSLLDMNMTQGERIPVYHLLKWRSLLQIIIAVTLAAASFFVEWGLWRTLHISQCKKDIIYLSLNSFKTAIFDMWNIGVCNLIGFYYLISYSILDYDKLEEANIFNISVKKLLFSIVFISCALSFFVTQFIAFIYTGVHNTRNYIFAGIGVTLFYIVICLCKCRKYVIREARYIILPIVIYQTILFTIFMSGFMVAYIFRDYYTLYIGLYPMYIGFAQTLAIMSMEYYHKLLCWSRKKYAVSVLNPEWQQLHELEHMRKNAKHESENTLSVVDHVHRYYFDDEHEKKLEDEKIRAMQSTIELAAATNAVQDKQNIAAHVEEQKIKRKEKDKNSKYTDRYINIDGRSVEYLWNDELLYFICGLLVISLEAMNVGTILELRGNTYELVKFFVITVIFQTLQRNNLYYEFFYRVILRKPTPPLSKLDAILNGAKFQWTYLPIFCLLLMNITSYGPSNPEQNCYRDKLPDLYSLFNEEGGREYWYMIPLMYVVEFISKGVSELVTFLCRKWGVFPPEEEDLPRKSIVVRIGLPGLTAMFVTGLVVVQSGFMLNLIIIDTLTGAYSVSVLEAVDQFRVGMNE